MLYTLYKTLLPSPTHYKNGSKNADSINNSLNPKSKKQYYYDDDALSSTSSTQSFHSSAQNADTYIDCGRKSIKETDPLTTRTKHVWYNLPEISRSISPGDWLQSDVVAIPIIQEHESAANNHQASSNPKNPKRNNYGSSSKNCFQDSDLFPEEKLKTLIAGLITCLGFIATATSIVLTHERVPNRTKYGPLPDIFLDNAPAVDWALDYSEYIILVSMNSICLVLIFHRHRFIVFRRLFLIMAILYFYRAITMYVTTLPIASRTYHCDPKMGNITFPDLIKRVLKLISGLGLSINGKHVYCGDFIYSGHTVTLILSYLFISEYTPEKFWVVHWIYWSLAYLGIVLLQFSHGHYTIDILVAYYVTTTVFWTYHILANNKKLKEDDTPRNHYSYVWWFRIFQYFEKNVGDRVPNDFDWPHWCSNKRSVMEE